MRLLTIALVALLAQQTLTAMSRLVLPITAPVLAENLGISPALVGVYSGILSCVAMVVATGCGGFIRRFGAWRISQVGLIAMGCGVMAASPGVLAFFILSAVLVGLGPGSTTPAGAHVLARYCPPRHAPLLFSIKQSGVPLGGLLAGLVIPLLVLQLGWRGAFVITGAAYLVLALLFQPFRPEFDDDRDPGRRLTFAEFRGTFHELKRDAALRELAIAAFAFAGLQVTFDTFFVTYLVKGLGVSLTAAGSVFALGQGVAIFTRILWGGLAGRVVAPRHVLAGLALVMAGASAAMLLLNESWPLAAITAVAVLYTATGFSWHGVLLAEVARLAPDDRVASVTGGVLAVVMGGAMIYPICFAAILQATGEYGYGYLMVAVPALLIGIQLFRRRG